MPIELDIAGNFAKGQQATLQRRRGRQMEQAIDLELGDQTDKQTSRRNLYEMYERSQGRTPDTNYFQGLQDPFAMRIMDWWKQRRAARRPAPAGVVTTEDVPEPGGALPLEEIPGYGYADGGKVDEAKARRQRLIEQERQRSQQFRDPQAGRLRAEQAMRNAPTPGVDNLRSGTAQIQAGQERRASEFRRAGTNTRSSYTARPGEQLPRTGRVERVTNALRGRGASAASRSAATRGGALALGLNILPQLDADYDERMNERFGFTPNTASDAEGGAVNFMKFFGKRLLGYASDLGGMFGADALYRDNQAEAAPAPQAEQGEKSVEAEPVAAPDQALALQAEEASDPAPQAAQRGAQEQMSEPPEEIDFMPDEMPNMSVRDWAEYRSRAVGEMMRGGMGEAEANDQITKLQHSGFMSLGQQALAMLQAGDTQNAARALKAAYQYFPNGADVSFGVQGGHLIGMGRNEETGEPIGKPMILNEERLAMMMQNFAKPETFTAWTKDWRDEAFRERQYNEVTRPSAQAAARAGQTNAQANLLDAQSNAAYRASGGARGPDPGPDDRARSEAVFREQLELMSVQPETAGKARQLASIMAQVRARYPDTRQLPDNEIVQLILQADEAGQLDGIVQQFGLK